MLLASGRAQHDAVEGLRLAMYSQKGLVRLVRSPIHALSPPVPSWSHTSVARVLQSPVPGVRAGVCMCGIFAPTF